MGAGANVNAFFGVMTMIIAIPTGVKIFNWIFTMYRGRVRFAVPMLWFFGFVFTFTIGGITGVIMAVPPIDFQLHNSLFLVAHFHNMVIGGVVFGYLAAINYWFPKFFGFKLNERLGKLSFGFWIVGFALAFIPLYILGIMGATRRLNTYDSSLGWQQLFIVALIGAVLIVIGIMLFVLQIVVSVIKRKQNLDLTGDPRDGRNLEWSVSSPAPFYNFAKIPVVHDRNAWWEAKHSNSKTLNSNDYDKIVLHKNTPLGFIIGFLAFLCWFCYCMAHFMAYHYCISKHCLTTG
jgi:cytochrome o ubiquinol oxidase subunit 1